MTIRYGSVCSGIEAASVAWQPLGWERQMVAEIDAFPSALLTHHYPNTPNYGDITRFQEWPDAAIDLLAGGTPCQSFSVAGLRKGLADPRGNLALTFLGIADRYRPEWLIWENVPGVLSLDGGRAFGSILGGLAKLGFGFAYRVLDAQYVRVDGFGRAVPQRRRRVFVVGNSRDWRRAAAVLFEPESLSGHTAPSREAGQGVAGTIAAGAHPSGFNGRDAERGNVVTHALRADGFDASEDGTGRGTPIVPVIAKTLTRGAESAGKGGYAGRRQEDDDNLIAFGWQNSSHQGISESPHIAPTLDKSKTPAVAFSENIRAEVVENDTMQSLATGGGKPGQGYPAIRQGWAVRRLTPRECERLQGFPDDYTAVTYRGKPAADGPRYKALGNSMAVNVMRWIGERIETIRKLT